MTAEVAYLERAAEARRSIPEIIRLLLAVTQRPARDLAGALGISTGRLSERLTGKVRITSDELAACALFFGVDAGVFYRDPADLRRTILGGVIPRPGAGAEAAHSGASTLNGDTVGYRNTPAQRPCAEGPNGVGLLPPGDLPKAKVA